MFNEQLSDLDRQRDELLTEARALTETGLEGDTLVRFETIETEIADLAKRRDAIERAARSMSDGSVTRVSGDGAR